jgi:hypothetical protein
MGDSNQIDRAGPTWDLPGPGKINNWKLPKPHEPVTRNDRTCATWDLSARCPWISHFVSTRCRAHRHRGGSVSACAPSDTKWQIYRWVGGRGVGLPRRLRVLGRWGSAGRVGLPSMGRARRLRVTWWDLFGGLPFQTYPTPSNRHTPTSPRSGPPDRSRTSRDRQLGSTYLISGNRATAGSRSESLRAPSPPSGHASRPPAGRRRRAASIDRRGSSLRTSLRRRRAAGSAQCCLCG